MIDRPGPTAPHAARGSTAPSGRRWLPFAAALVVLVLVAIGFLTANLPTELGNGTDLRPHEGLEKSLRPIPTEVAYVSRDAALVAFVDVRRLTETAFGRSLASLPRVSELRASLLADTGIDVSADVNSLIIVASRPGSTRNRPLP